MKYMIENKSAVPDHVVMTAIVEEVQKTDFTQEKIFNSEYWFTAKGYGRFKMDIRKYGDKVKIIVTNVEE